jgi:hypothetical protein
MPSSQWPPTTIVEGQGVILKPCRNVSGGIIDGEYEMTPWGSVKMVVETFPARIVLVCKTGEDGISRPYVVTYQQSRRIIARDLCVASTASSEG